MRMAIRRCHYADTYFSGKQRSKFKLTTRKCAHDDVDVAKYSMHIVSTYLGFDFDDFVVDTRMENFIL